MRNDISELIYRSILGTLSEEERGELDSWLAEDEANEEFLKEIRDIGSLMEDRERRRMIDTRRPAADMRRRLSELRAPARRRRRFAAVAAVAAVITGVMIHLGGIDLSTGQSAPAATSEPMLSINDIRHGSTGAIVSNGNGVSVLLEESDTCMTAIQHATELLAPSEKAAEQLCLDVGRGKEFKIVLEDSTEVWLNSESQLHYPKAFGQDERRVAIVGEAYFKVRKDADRPFYVESNGQVVRVYGTTFNIKAYPDENITYTTLENGSISLRQLDGDGGELYLSPGHQALFDREEQRVNMKIVKTEVITGWRHGRFVFEEQPLSNIMRDLSRWYDFEYEFADPNVGDIVFLGSIPRYADFKTAISILEKSGGIRFSLTDGRIVISKITN